MEDKPDVTVCPKCEAPSRSIIVLGHGGPRKNNPGWLKEVNAFFRDDGHHFETTGDYRNFVVKNPSIVPQHGHPAIPSWVGDRLQKPPPEKELKAKRRKMANERLRDMRKLTVNTRPAGQPA